MIIKVKPCFSNPRRGGTGLNPRKDEKLAEYALTPPLLSNKRVNQLFICPIFQAKGN